MQHSFLSNVVPFYGAAVSVYLGYIINITLNCSVFHSAEICSGIFLQYKMTEINYETIKCQLASLETESKMKLLKLLCYMSLVCGNAD